MSSSLRPHELQQARPPCPSSTSIVYPNSCPLSWWCHPTISSSVIPFSSCPQSFPASGSFQMSQLFAWGGQSTGVSVNSSPCFIKLGHQKFLGVMWKKESNDLLRKGYWNDVNITYDELSHSISCSMGDLRGYWKTHWWGKCQHPWKAL